MVVGQGSSQQLQRTALLCGEASSPRPRVMPPILQPMIEAVSHFASYLASFSQ